MVGRRAACTNARAGARQRCSVVFRASDGAIFTYGRWHASESAVSGSSRRPSSSHSPDSRTRGSDPRRGVEAGGGGGAGAVAGEYAGQGSSRLSDCRCRGSRGERRKRVAWQKGPGRLSPIWPPPSSARDPLRHPRVLVLVQRRGERKRVRESNYYYYYGSPHTSATQVPPMRPRGG